MRKNAILFLTLLGSCILFALLAGMYFHKLAEQNEGEAQEQQIIPQEFGETDTIEQDKSDSETVDASEKDDFADTLFVGDSRTIGLMEYGNIEQATFFADNGMSVFN